VKDRLEDEMGGVMAGSTSQRKKKGSPDPDLGDSGKRNEGLKRRDQEEKRGKRATAGWHAIGSLLAALLETSGTFMKGKKETDSCGAGP